MDGLVPWAHLVTWIFLPAKHLVAPNTLIGMTDPRCVGKLIGPRHCVGATDPAVLVNCFTSTFFVIVDTLDFLENIFF